MEIQNKDKYFYGYHGIIFSKYYKYFRKGFRYTRMIKLIDLYNRIVETTGLDVMTLGSLRAAIANCMADLTSRGYKIFKETC